MWLDVYVSDISAAHCFGVGLWMDVRGSCRVYMPHSWQEKVMTMIPGRGMGTDSGATDIIFVGPGSRFCHGFTTSCREFVHRVYQRRLQ